MRDRHSAIRAEIRQRRPFRSLREEAYVSLLRTAWILRRPIAGVIEDRGISMAQYNVLRILRGAGGEGLPTLTIRERMIEEAAGITRLIDKLEEGGLAIRDRTTSPDRRQVYCRITGAGLALLAKLDLPVKEVSDFALSAVDDSQLATFCELLDTLRSAHRHANGPDEGGVAKTMSAQESAKTAACAAKSE